MKEDLWFLLGFATGAINDIRALLKSGLITEAILAADKSQEFLMKHVGSAIYGERKNTEPILDSPTDFKITNNWIKTKDELPPAGQEVIAYYKNSHGEQKRIRAFYAPRFTIEDNNEYEGAEYCEEKDEYFLVEGWYESNEHEEVRWFVDEEVTHWTTLPPPPEE